MLVLTLLACAKKGDADVRSAADAPFEVDGSAAVWATGPDNDGLFSEAALLITEGESDCDALTESNLFNDLDDSELPGSGLLFALTYDDIGRIDDFEGLWMPGYAYGNGGERYMAMVPFSDGFFYVTFGGYYGMLSDAWVRIDHMGNTIDGEFSSTYWSGTFSALDCGAWDDPSQTHEGSGR